MLCPTNETVGPPQLTQQKLRPVRATQHASPDTFVHKDLKESTHVFLSQDAAHRALDPTYSGPHKFRSSTDKILKIYVRAKTVTVSADRAKPENILNEQGSTTGSSRGSRIPQSANLPDTSGPRTTSTGRRIRVPPRLNT
jgi:hypothetical protein